MRRKGCPAASAQSGATCWRGRAWLCGDGGGRAGERRAPAPRRPAGLCHAAGDSRSIRKHVTSSAAPALLESAANLIYNLQRCPSGERLDKPGRAALPWWLSLVF